MIPLNAATADSLVLGIWGISVFCNTFTSSHDEEKELIKPYDGSS